MVVFGIGSMNLIINYWKQVKIYEISLAWLGYEKNGRK